MKVNPFVKWVGGKRGIISELLKRIPKKFENYWEPCIGGGALFFSIIGSIEKGYISDINTELMICYQVLKENPELLIQKLKVHQKNHSEEYFYRIRSIQENTNQIEIAARFIYLNKTCFNGIYRVNKKGQFNVSIGRYLKPKIVDEQNIRCCSIVLRKAEIENGDFSMITPGKRDLVYFDPPYQQKKENSFTCYDRKNFKEGDQIRLKEFVDLLTKKGIFVMISNSNTGFIRKIYQEYNIDVIKAPRSVCCDSKKRMKEEELIIRNY